MLLYSARYAIAIYHIVSLYRTLLTTVMMIHTSNSKYQLLMLSSLVLVR
jgi:hypothetical protein